MFCVFLLTPTNANTLENSSLEEDTSLVDAHTHTRPAGLPQTWRASRTPTPSASAPRTIGRCPVSCSIAEVLMHNFFALVCYE